LRRWLFLFAVLAAAAVLGWRAAQPPVPLPASAPASDFAAGRAMADIRVIAARPHETGSVANEAVRAHLIARLQALGFTVRTTAVPLPERARKRLAAWGAANAATAVATNIIALRPGRDPTSDAVALMAHYDSVFASPGAGDDAAGVAAILEIARAIPRAAQARDLVVLLTDGEELGLVGARGFFAPGIAGDPLAARIGALINLETRGGGGRAFLIETGPGSAGIVDAYAAVAPSPSASSMAVKVYELLPNSTDFTPARQRGIAGVNFAFTGRASLYHSPLATPDAIEAGAVQHLGDQALAVARALLTAPALPVAGSDRAFGDVLGAFAVSYPLAAGWLPILLVAAALALTARARRDWHGIQVAGAMLDGLVITAAYGVLAYAGNLLSGADGPNNYYDRLAALPRLEIVALLMAVAAAALTLALVPKRRSLWDGWLGLTLLVLVMVMALQLWLPAGGPVLAWPLLPAALAMAVAARADLAGRLLAAVAAVLGLAFILGIGHATLLGIGISAPSGVAVFAPLVLLLVWPLVPHHPDRRALLIAALVAALAGAALAVSVRLDPLAVSVPPFDPKK